MISIVKCKMDYMEYVGQSSINIFDLLRIPQTRIDRLHVILFSSYYDHDILSSIVLGWKG